MLGQQLFSPFKHLLPEGEVLLPLGEIRHPLIQGGILCLEVLLGQDNVAGLIIQLPLPFLDPLHGRGLLGPLLVQDLVHGAQLGAQLRDDLLPLVQVLLLLGHPLLLPARLQLPVVHLLEVLLVVFAVPRQFGLLKGEPLGRHLGALLQLGTPVTEALVLRFQRLPLPLDHRLGLLKGLMRTRQHPGERDRCRFWLGVTEPPKSLGPPTVVLV
jgi:hypothetical protein